MSVYVDSLRPTLPSKRWRYPSACHMIADSLEELHAFAQEIGLRRSWFQNTALPHYDLTEARRAKALEMGAVPMTTRDLVTRLRAARAGQLGG